MKISKKWLERYMNLDGLTMEGIAQAITNAGFEVEAVEPVSQGTNLVIGEVLTCENHPDSDHLHVTTVNVGDEVLNIVCGAPNVAAGQKVIVAKPGAQLPGGTIKSGKIRGQESNGMICALFELGVDKHLLSEEQIDGIEVLPADAPVGCEDPLGYLGYDDVILDVSLTPNRADCQAVFSMAKEIGAVLNREVNLPDFEGAADEGEGHASGITVTSETEGCPLFLEKTIGHVTLKESPAWMKELLRASGMNSINNVVDISNIVMLETGQPMHFYDLRGLKGKDITVRTGFDEDYEALDEEVYRLQPEDLVITSEGKPIGIAGIMGGEDSKILEDTTGLVIECALFDRVSIRNTARRLNLNTEASMRYQKGIEPLAGVKALNRAVQLLKEYADASDLEETVVYGNPEYVPGTITFTLDEINRRLGTDFGQDEVLDVLTRLEFSPEVQDENITVTIPSTRTDVEGMADISEEVIRILGYDRLPSTLPHMEMTEGKLTPEQKAVRFARTFFTEEGLQDCITYTLVSDEKNEDAVLPAGDAVALSIPLSEERKLIRTSVLPSLLEAAAYNRARGIKDVNLFEISDTAAKDRTELHLAIVMTGSLQQTRWMHYDLPSDFYTLKGLLESFMERMGFAASRIFFKENKKDQTHFHPGRSAEVYLGKDLVGILGEIHPAWGKKLGLKGAVIAEIRLGALINAKKSKIRFQPVSRYPAVSRDLAFVVKKEMPAQKIVDTVLRNGKLGKENIVKSAEVFDVYEGEHVAPDEKSIALNMTFQSEKQTLNDEEISQVFGNIIKAIEKNCNAVLRKG